MSPRPRRDAVRVTPSPPHHRDSSSPLSRYPHPSAFGAPPLRAAALDGQSTASTFESIERFRPLHLPGRTLPQGEDINTPLAKTLKERRVDELPPAQQHGSHCDYWSQIGECEANTQWMLANCRASCAGRGIFSQVGDQQRGVRPPPSSCVDEAEHCDSWARAGECESNPNFMAVRCAFSCRVCGTAV
jgi:hypothetical protein